MRARTLRARLEQQLTTFGEQLLNFVFTLSEFLRGLCHRVTLDQDIFVFKFALWIFRSVALLLHAIVILKDLRPLRAGPAINFMLGPNIELAFGMLGFALRQ